MTTAAMSDLFTSWKPDLMGVILGTNYMRFTTAIGIKGLAKQDGVGGLDVLAVLATNEGTGQFRRFIAAAKERFSRVGVWHEMNPIVGAALKRYGFRRAKYTESDGEVVHGWQWTLRQHGTAKR